MSNLFFLQILKDDVVDVLVKHVLKKPTQCGSVNASYCLYIHYVGLRKKVNGLMKGHRHYLYLLEFTESIWQGIPPKTDTQVIIPLQTVTTCSGRGGFKLEIDFECDANRFCICSMILLIYACLGLTDLEDAVAREMFTFVDDIKSFDNKLRL